MRDQHIDDVDMPEEIDFSKGVRGLHHIPPGAKVLMPASIERSVWEYFSGKAEQRGVELSELLTEVLKRDIEIKRGFEVGCRDVSPETRRWRGRPSRYCLITVPSLRRTSPQPPLSLFRSSNSKLPYGYFAASFSSTSMPQPGASLA
jgi:hypothetical protein